LNEFEEDTVNSKIEGIVEAYYDPSNPGSFKGADELSKKITCSKKAAEKAKVGSLYEKSTN